MNLERFVQIMTSLCFALCVTVILILLKFEPKIIVTSTVVGFFICFFLQGLDK
jgi:hypothetical protein